MSHTRHVIDSWDNEDEDLEKSFVLSSDDLDPLGLETKAAASRPPFGDAATGDDDSDCGLDDPSSRSSESTWSHPVPDAESDDGFDADWAGTIRASARPTALWFPSGGRGGLRTVNSVLEVNSFAAGGQPHRSDVQTDKCDDDDDVDLILPSGLSHLTLQPLRLRPSASTFILGPSSSNSKDWTASPEPPSSTCSNTPSLIRDGGSEAEPSSSDIDFDLQEPDDHRNGRDVDNDDGFGENSDGGLDGIVLPDPLLFTRANAPAYLRSLLEVKFKGSNSTTTISNARHPFDFHRPPDTVRIASGLDSAFSQAADDSFEEDLVLDDDDNNDRDAKGDKRAPVVPLISMARLDTVRARSLTAAGRARTLPLPPPRGSRERVDSSTPARAGMLSAVARSVRTNAPLSTSTDDEWTRELERGWGRPKSPVPPPSFPVSTLSVASLGKGRPSLQARSTTAATHISPSEHVASGSTVFRRQNSPARLDEPLSTSLSTASINPSPPQPLQLRFPGSYAQGLLARKASLPLLSLAGSGSSSPGDSARDDDRADSPSAAAAGGQHQRFAAPTASSLARKRERSTLGDRGSIMSSDVYSPPSALTPVRSRAATPQLTSSPSPASSLARGPMSALGPGSRLTMPTSSTRLKTRAPVSHGVFGSTSSTISSSHRSLAQDVVSSPAPPRPPLQIHRALLPRSARKYGDGTELDGLEDLSDDAEKERLSRVPAGKPSGSHLSDVKYGRPQASASLKLRTSAPRARVNSTLTAGTASSELKRKKSPLTASEAPGGTQRGERKRPGPTLKVIRNLNGANKARVEGKMRYNPATFRWEGNESVLQAFEPTPTPARPALITHLTGPAGSRAPGSPVAALPGPAIGARVVGHMQFDPVQMCWISLLDKYAEEPDPFADMTDEEEADHDLSFSADDMGSRSRSCRSRRNPSSANPLDDDDGSEFELAPESTLPPVNLADFIRRGPAEYELARRSRLAEEGHQAEVAQWALGTALTQATANGGDTDRDHLWEIRKVALRAGRDERIGGASNNGPRTT